MNVIIEVKKIDYDKNSNEGYVEAFIEDYTYLPNNNEGVEGFPINFYYSTFSLEEDENIPSDPDEQCIFFEDLNLKWTLMTH